MFACLLAACGELHPRGVAAVHGLIRCLLCRRHGAAVSRLHSELRVAGVEHVQGYWRNRAREQPPGFVYTGYMYLLPFACTGIIIVALMVLGTALLLTWRFMAVSDSL